MDRERKQRMLWIILSVICAAYYAAVRYVAQAQQLTGIWLVLAVLFLLLFFYGWYRKKHPESRSFQSLLKKLL